MTSKRKGATVRSAVAILCTSVLLRGDTLANTLFTFAGAHVDITDPNSGSFHSGIAWPLGRLSCAAMRALVADLFPCTRIASDESPALNRILALNRLEAMFEQNGHV